MASPFQYVSFGGVALGCSTPELEAEVNRLLAINGRKEWDAWNFTAAGTNPGVLPTPSAPIAPPIQTGVLHWPNDATRPAWFYAVVDQTQLNRINAVYTGPADPLDLILRDGRAGAMVSAKMSMLPPRPISQLGLPDTLSTNGWLLAFTDQRFWWQWRSGSITERPDSWTDLYAQLGVILGRDITVETIDSAYGTPTDKWIGYLRPPATVLDAVAASVGQRIVVALDGTVRAVNWETAKQESDDQWELNLPQSMGGYIPSDEIGKYVPASLNIAGIDKTTTGPNGEIVPYTEIVTLDDLNVPGYDDATGASGSTSTVFVDFEYDGPSDDYAWAALVDVAGEDWYGWRLADLDIAFPGIVAWGPTGWEDFIEWMVKLTEPWIDESNPHEPLIATAIRRPPFSDFPSTIMPTTGGSAFSGLVRLIESGTGIDTGTAWGAKLMHEVDGNIVTSTEWLGGVEEAPWVLYATDEGYDGRDGFPEAGDIVAVFPDPDLAGRWLFVPKTINPSDCGECSWLANLPHETCLLFEQLGGGSDGMCDCFPAKSETVMVYHSGAPAGWRGIEMGTSCCGCGGMIFNVTTGSEDYDATLQMYRYHVSCGSGGGIFTKNLKLECCGTDGLGRKFAIFTGWGSDACDGEPAGCDNAFRIQITCGTCPTTSCTCDACLVCCEGQTPLGFYGDFFSFPNDNYNGYWSYAPVLGENCIWRAECGAYTSELVLTTELVGPAIVVKATLTHGTSVYTATDWNCCEGGDLTKESGDGPTTVALGPLKVNGECPECVKVWPDVLYMEFYDIVETGIAVFPYPANTPIAMSKVAGPWTPTTGWQDDDTGLCNRFNCDAGGLPGCDGFGSNGGAIGTNGTQLNCVCTPILCEESFLYTNIGPVENQNIPFSACPVGGGGNVGMIGDTISYKVRVME